MPHVLRGVAEVACGADLDHMLAVRHNISGDLLVEFALDVAWKRQRFQPDGRLRRCPLPDDHADRWWPLVDTAVGMNISTTLVRQTTPRSQSCPSGALRCTQGQNPRQARAVAMTHCYVVTAIQGPPGTRKIQTLALAHVVASHMASLPQGAALLVAAHARAAVELAHAWLRHSRNFAFRPISAEWMGGPISCYRD